MNHIRAIFWLFAILLPLGLAWLGNFNVTTPVDLSVALNHHLPARQALARDWDVELAFPNLQFRNALLLRESPSAANEWFLVERTGRILAFENDPSGRMSRSVVDLTMRLGGPLDQEQGVLGLAFHPEFENSNSPSHGDIFVFYAGREDLRCFNRLSRFHVSQNPDVALASEVVLIDQTDPHPWHNAGCLEFGPDGFLYLGVGDGGGVNDEFQNSQRIDAGLFSGILRIDVDRRGGEISHPPPRQPAHGRTTGYFIPNDNPFVGRPDSLEEFWSIGLRNPFRMGFDTETKQLWVADVGSLGAEEINLVTRGSNHQWSYREGFEAFPYSPLKGSVPENLIGLETPPRHAYPEAHGTHCTQEGFCVIGGTVYHGKRHPSLAGQYLFGDFGTGRIWTMPATSEDGKHPRELIQLPSSGNHRLCCISIDRAGEIFLVVGAAAEESSTIYRLKARETDGESLPKLLSETGLFRSLEPLMSGPGLIPYEVNSPLWSNGAAKKRWMGLPALGRVEVQGDGRWEFPQGTIFVKHFEAPAPTVNAPPRKLETRILVRSGGMGLYGATYRWLDDGSDALLVDREGENCEALLPASGGQIEPQSYHLPGRNECLHCHNQHAGLILGVNSKQLNRPLSEGQENQLTHWSRLKFFNRKLTIAEKARRDSLLPVEGPVHSLDRRVRSYLDANCSHCHRPGANIRAWFDLRAETPLAATGLLNGNVADNLEIDDAKIIVPGNSDRSILFQRIAHRDPRFRMPPLAVSVVDQIAVREIQAWMAQCNPSPDAAIDSFGSHGFKVPMMSVPAQLQQSLKIVKDQGPTMPSFRWGAWSDVLTCYYLSMLLISLGMLVSFTLLLPGRPIPYGESDFLLRFTAWDGGQFMQVVEHGYQYDPNKISNVVVFPGFPMLAKGLMILTGCSSAVALLLLSHVFLILSFLLLHRYVCLRFPGQSALPGWTIVAFSLFPTTFFFRMAYSESMFLFFCLLMFYGMQRRWPIPLIAIIAGACTGTRLVGVALIIPLMMHIFHREKQTIDRAAQVAISLPIAVWGMVAFMFYQLQVFDDPFVFAKAQANFHLRPHVDLPDRLLQLFCGEPIWNTYVSSSSAYWHKHSPEPSPWLNMQFSNPLYFVLAVLLLVTGWFKRVLNQEEAVFTALLLAIPYFSRGHEFCMGSQARYAAAAFPLYIVWGAVLKNLPLPITGSLLGLWGFLLAMYTALFGAWYFFV